MTRELKISAIFTLSLGLAACTTTAPQPSGDDAAAAGVTAEESHEVSETAVSELPTVSTDEKETLPPLGPEEDIDEEVADQELDDMGEGFCKDDIISKYLIKQYVGARPIVEKRKKLKGRNRHLSQKTAESEALHFARSRLLGPVIPYFGSMPVVANARVEYWIRYFQTEGHHAFMKWLVRGESLKNVVMPLLRSEGLPPELFYLAMIESGFSSSAYSRAKATGPWQFMNGTAKLYGLKINYWVDERRDPIKSTIAAARFLRDLYEEFGDWYLAMAAYNAGPGKVKKAIAALKTKDFWKLADSKYLKAETRHYVPKVLGALIIATSPQMQGFDVISNPIDRIPSKVALVKRPVRIAELSSQLNVPALEILRWNPELIHGITPPDSVKNGYELRLPESIVHRYSEVEPNLSYIEVRDVKMHTVRKGETLAKIARYYHVRTNQILSLNPDIRTKALKVGRAIAVPIPTVVERVKRPRAA